MREPCCWREKDQAAAETSEPHRGEPFGRNDRLEMNRSVLAFQVCLLAKERHLREGISIGDEVFASLFRIRDRFGLHHDPKSW